MKHLAIPRSVDYIQKNLLYAGHNQTNNMKKKFLITGIVYDTDGENVVLPRTMTVFAEDEDDAINEVTEKTGWLVESVDDIKEI